MLKRLLVGVSGTAALDAKISYCLDLAKRLSAKVGVIAIVDVDRLSHLGLVPIGAGYRRVLLYERSSVDMLTIFKNSPLALFISH